MKKLRILLLAFILLAAQQISAQEIQWMTLNEAMAAQAKTPKKIIMDVYTTWCGPCKMLEKNTFQNPDVVAYINKNYYAVKFNAEGNDVVNYKDQKFENPNYNPNSGRNSSHQFAQALQIRAYPTIVFFDEKGETLIPLPGYKTPAQLELFLKLFETDDHLLVKSEEDWIKYQEGFKPEFRDVIN